MDLSLNYGEDNSMHYQITVLIITIPLVIAVILIYFFFIFWRRCTNYSHSDIEMIQNPQQPPISIDDIGITTVVFDPNSDTGNPYGMPTCHICCEDFCEGEPLGSLTACNHIYHEACIASIVASQLTKCPVCRCNMISISVEDANNDIN